MMQSPRYEVKMTCDEMYLPDVHTWLNLHPDTFIEAYPPRQVNSLYFDTRENDCLMDNLIGTGQRQKLRFRWYGAGYSAVRGALELKRKLNQLGWKVHYPVPVTFDLMTTSWSSLMWQMREQVDGPFSIWLSYLNQPTLINSYTREYYESMDHQVRVTIDYDQVAYEQITHLTPNLVDKAPIPSQVVVEIKADATLHRRVSDVLSSLPLQVGRNSKYVSGLIGALCFL
jgi:hypothetical protein